MDRLIQEIILKELEKYPKGRTTKQLHRAVKRKMKKLQKALDTIYNLWYNKEKLRESKKPIIISGSGS